MIHEKHLKVLAKIWGRLNGTDVNWVVTGSLSFAIRGVPVQPRDVDIQTDRPGAYEMERLFPESVTRKVEFSSSESARIRSHFGALEIDGVTVEVMGDVEHLLEDGTWEPPPDLNAHKQFVEIAGMRIPVLSLEYEYQAYLKLGRLDKAHRLKQALGSEP